MNEFDLNIILSEGEKSHPLWSKLSAHFNAKLQQLRGKNDGPLSPDETATIRGQIHTLKSLIALGDKPPPIDG